MTTHGLQADEKRSLHAEFSRLVNMTPAQLRHWLASDDSRAVGMTPAGERVTGLDQPESVGHHMGETLLRIQAKKQAEFSAEEYAAMRKVVGYIHRHSAQRPDGDITDTRWRKSLMNWGHDPGKDT